MFVRYDHQEFHTIIENFPSGKFLIASNSRKYVAATPASEKSGPFRSHEEAHAAVGTGCLVALILLLCTLPHQKVLEVLVVLLHLALRSQRWLGHWCRWGFATLLLLKQQSRWGLLVGEELAAVPALHLGIEAVGALLGGSPMMTDLLLALGEVLHVGVGLEIWAKRLIHQLLKEAALLPSVSTALPERQSGLRSVLEIQSIASLPQWQFGASWLKSMFCGISHMLATRRSGVGGIWSTEVHGIDLDVVPL